MPASAEFPASPAASVAAWTRRDALHLVRRTHAGARKRDVDAAFADGSAQAAVERLVRQARAEPLPEAPSWITGTGGPQGVERVYEVQRRWLDSLRTGGLREKMVLFLHNLLALQYPGLGERFDAARLSWDYLGLLRTRALGNFRTLLYDVGLDAAMLRYLHNAENEKTAPNEDFARELLELFSMGQTGPDGTPNYTEADVKEIARALTGWTVSAKGRVAFDLARHDRGAKTIFGQTGLWNYDDVLRLVFEQRAGQIAHFVARHLVAFFVAPVPDDALVRDVAAALRAHDFELAPTLTALFTDARFYAPGVVGARIKSPVEFLVGFLREAEIPATDALLEALRETLQRRLSMELLNPPNVAGWPGLKPPGSDGAPGHYTWLTTASMPERWRLIGQLLGGGGGATPDLLGLARKVSDPGNPFALAADLASLLIPVPLEEAGIPALDAPFGGSMSYQPPQDVLDGPAYRLHLAKILLDGTPPYDWAGLAADTTGGGTRAVERLLRAYLAFLTQLPEYQLT